MVRLARRSIYAVLGIRRLRSWLPNLRSLQFLARRAAAISLAIGSVPLSSFIRFVLTFAFFRRLDDCGHRCLAKCHSDVLHRVFKCPQACERLFSPCNHGCPNDCGDPCGLCYTEVSDILLPCSHVKEQLRCHQAQNLSTVECTASVQKQVPGCNHVIYIPCYRDVSSDLLKCPEACATYLECGHQCQGTCGSCNIRAVEDRPATVKHRKCAKLCRRRHGTCNHTCQRECHGGNDCGLCFASCQVSALLTSSDQLCWCTPKF